MRRDHGHVGHGAARRWLALLGLVVLAACTQAPAPLVRDGAVSGARPPASAGARVPRERPAPATEGATSVIVAEGETVYTIARRHNVPVREVIERNGLQPPYALTPGTRLELTAVRLHLVQRGDTLYGVSRRYGVDSRALARANDLSEPFVLAVGQRLRLPAASFVPPAASPPPAAPQADGMRTGSRVGGSAGAVARQELPATRSPAVPAPMPGGAPTTEGPASAGPASAPEEPAAPPRATEAQAPAPTPAQRAAASAGRFLWPVRGEVLSRFGPKSDGRHNDGINIAAPLGTPVVAAESGVVAYAGAELRGFGSLVLIRHDGGWTTAYAHNSDVLVRRGDRVTRGQTIARVGATGGVSRPQAHFELRQGTRAVDPEPLLLSN